MITLNLITPSQKEEIRFRRIERRVWHLIGMGGSVLVLSAFLLYGSIVILHRELRTIQSRTSTFQKTMESEEGRNFKKNIQVFNSVIFKVEEIQGTEHRWSFLLTLLSSLVPSSIELHSASFGSNQFQFRGYAKDRESLLTLQENLKRSKVFIDPIVPLSNLLSKEDILFEMSGTLDWGMLQSR